MNTEKQSNIRIEIGAPASMPLGFVQWQGKDGRFSPALFGITLQHPPVHLSARSSKKFSISGARANIGRAYGQKFLAHHGLAGGDVEIELAIPAFVGLSSAPMLGLAVAQALAWVHDLPHKTADVPQLAQAINLQAYETLPLWSFAKGGLLLVATTTETGTYRSIIQRHEIAYTTEEDAWAFVFHFPPIASHISLSLAAERLAAWGEAAAYLRPDSNRFIQDDLAQALARRDIAAFGQLLMRLQKMNIEALKAAYRPLEINESQEALFTLMQENGALAWGQTLTGLGHYALVHGGQASRALRKKIIDLVGYSGGMVMATITANQGAQAILAHKDGRKTRLDL